MHSEIFKLSDKNGIEQDVKLLVDDNINNTDAHDKLQNFLDNLASQNILFYEEPTKGGHVFVYRGARDNNAIFERRVDESSSERGFTLNKLLKEICNVHSLPYPLEKQRSLFNQYMNPNTKNDIASRRVAMAALGFVTAACLTTATRAKPTI